ncbi:hypothetical protein MSG28_005934 [Choristoneura fumiferana]|uniref:Uncharacterized protein n=1 Tax=Choristoneura fumiferana TaxID=7141 RepID=A0ACC0L1H0_CHOFU|nr:hypothetical protein MSG28_005934 [Choristoneura fumiferana]
MVCCCSVRALHTHAMHMLRIAKSAISEGVVVSGLTPLVVSQAGHLLTHSLAHKMVETQVVKGSMVSAQYLSTAALKPVVVLPPPEPPT